MLTRFLFICAATLAFVGTSTGEVVAQVVTISDVQFKAAVGNNPPTAQPKGTVVVPGQPLGAAYRVVIDYGTFNQQAIFVPDNTIIGSLSAETFFPPKVGGNYTWTAADIHTLPMQLPQGLHARARLEVRLVVGGAWNPIQGGGSVAYRPVP
jgi:hypothetical protein